MRPVVAMVNAPDAVPVIPRPHVNHRSRIAVGVRIAVPVTIRITVSVTVPDREPDPEVDVDTRFTAWHGREGKSADDRNDEQNFFPIHDDNDPPLNLPM
jgi:hypothetical protein